MKAYRWPFILLTFGLAVALLLQAGLWRNAIVYLRADLGTLSLLLGLVTSIGLAVALTWSLSVQRQHERQLTFLKWEHTDYHRRFIRRLDHELKNPLTAIRAGLANLDQNNGAALSSVRAQVDRLARLSTDLRKLADIEKQPIEQESVDLGELLRELVESVREHPSANAARLKLTLPQAPWPLTPVAGDRDLLALALHNLIDNACKFSRPSDTIEVRAFEDGSSVVLEVADTGPGVTEEELPHLGEELYRGSAAMTVEGSGLGLALVQAIVARHQGTVSIRSRLGRGTVVVLRLPAAHF